MRNEVLKTKVIEHVPFRSLRGVCVLRYDNEVGKGDHCHFGSFESRYSYKFTTPDRLIADFQTDIARWNRENSNA